jgi:hypothetical protein
VVEEGQIEPISDQSPQYAPPVAAEVASETDEDKDPNESWWVEPQVEESEVAPAAEAQEQFDPDSYRDSRFGQFRQMVADSEQSQAESEREPEPETRPAAFEPQDESVPALETPSDLDAVEEDTEAFLEKVFSQLENNGQPEEEGHGLLRRRRLGSVLKELTEED